MASQADKDTAAAKAKQGGGQAAIDTAAAKAKQNNNNQAAIDTAAAKAKQGGGQAAIDTAAAKAKQNGGDGGTSERMSQREAEAGLSNTTSGRGASGVSSSRAEDAAGANVLEDGSVARSASGSSDPFYVFEREIPSEETVDHGVHDNTNDTLPSPVSSFSAIVAINGKPFSASIQGIIGNEITD